MTGVLPRRNLLALLGLGVAATLAGCGGTAEADFSAPAERKPYSHVRATRKVALTIDDGYDAQTLAAYVKLCEDTGLHLTFCAVGSIAANWKPVASRVASLIERGQVQVVNHTYNHRDLKLMSDSQIKADLERNEAWIQQQFKHTSRPYFRPPNGTYDGRVQAAAASAGFTRTLLWQGSFGDSVVLAPAQLLSAATDALRGGAVVLGHANHPTVVDLYPQIVALIKARRLTPSTVDELFS